MNQQNTKTPTLFSLLARQWDTGAAIKSMLFNKRQTAVAFALDNDTVTIADAEDHDPPTRRIHISAENGRSTIAPRSTAPAPLTSVSIEDSGDALLACTGDLDFILLAATGLAHRISPDGAVDQINMKLDGPVNAADNCPASGRLACACGSRLYIFDDVSEAPLLCLDRDGPISAIGFSPDGQSIALAHEHGLTIRPLSADQAEGRELAYSGQPKAVHWSPNGEWIATPLGSGGVQLSSVQDGRSGALTDYPVPVISVTWNRQANALVTSGAFRVTAWSMDTPPIEDTSTGVLETGRAGLIAVRSVANHPDRNLVVAGYDNGCMTVAQIGNRDELTLTSEAHGAVSHLAWSRDGRKIAAGTDRGLAAIVSLPPQMFK